MKDLPMGACGRFFAARTWESKTAWQYGRDEADGRGAFSVDSDPFGPLPLNM